MHLCRPSRREEAGREKGKRNAFLRSRRELTFRTLGHHRIDSPLTTIDAALLFSLFMLRIIIAMRRALQYRCSMFSALSVFHSSSSSFVHHRLIASAT